MDLETLIQGGGLVVSGAAVAKIADALSKMWAARHQKTEIATQPLDVRKAPDYVTCEQCRERHAEVEKRLEAGDRAFQELRHDIHNGFQRVTDRISPVAEACAANSAALQVLLKHQPTDKLP